LFRSVLIKFSALRTKKNKKQKKKLALYVLVFITLLTHSVYSTPQGNDAPLPTPLRDPNGDYFNMLTLTSKIINPPSSWSLLDSPCQWQGVVCNIFTGTVSMLIFTNMGLLGTMNFSYIPVDVVDANFDGNFLIGDFVFCPASPLMSLQVFSAKSNSLSGTVDMASLARNAPNLTTLVLDSNRLSGTLHLGAGPPSLQAVSISKNSLSDMPLRGDSLTNLVYVDASLNRLMGPLDLTALPPKIQYLNLQNNNFTGTPDLRNLPCNTSILLLGYNNLTGTPDLTHLVTGIAQLGLNSNSFSGTPDFSQLPAFVSPLFHLDLSANRFTGPVHIVVPGDANNSYSLATFSLGSNQFSGNISVTGKGSLSTLDMKHNLFSGNLTLTVMNVLNSLDFSDNRIDGVVLGGVVAQQVSFANNHLTFAPDLSGLSPLVRSIDLNSNRICGVLVNNREQYAWCANMREYNNMCNASRAATVLCGTERVPLTYVGCDCTSIPPHGTPAAEHGLSEILVVVYFVVPGVVIGLSVVWVIFYRGCQKPLTADHPFVNRDTYGTMRSEDLMGRNSPLGSGQSTSLTNFKEVNSSVPSEGKTGRRVGFA